MATKAEGDEKSLQGGASVYRRVGHKGADAIVQGNTFDSFEAAVEQGVDMIELDVLRGREGRLIVAHDYEDAARRRPLDLTEALDAFRDPPLDRVEIDCDLKLPGREAELAGALAGHGLVERAMVSTMEIESLRKLRQLEPDLRLGWTYPKTRRDWTQYGWARPGIVAGLAAMRRRFPKLLVETVPELDVDAVWAYHPLVTPNLVDAAEQVGVELIAWTVDELERMVALIELGVHGICSNDPRLFAVADRAPGPEKPAQETRAEKRAAKKAAKEAANTKSAATNTAAGSKAEEAG
jgi:glycerophosphoryl diester phosphodiesterase